MAEARADYLTDTGRPNEPGMMSTSILRPEREQHLARSGLRGLEEALARIGDSLDAGIRSQPIELNPELLFEEQNVVEHVAQNYSSIRSNPPPHLSTHGRCRLHRCDVQQSRIYNTSATRWMLHWTEQEGRQVALRDTLFEV